MRTFILIILFAFPSFAGGWQNIKSQVGTATTAKAEQINRWTKAGLINPSHELNKGIKNVSVQLDKFAGKMRIKFDYPSMYWLMSGGSVPMVIRFYDKNGQYLDNVYTNDFVLEDVYARTKPGTLARVNLDGRKEHGIERAGRIGKNNSFDIPVSQVVASHVGIVELGFDATSSNNPLGKIQEEYGLFKSIFKDWSKDKKY